MKRLYTNTQPFDQERFSTLITKIKGPRSIKQFSIDTDVSSAYISRLINRKRTLPPVPSTLLRLYRGNLAGISLKDLFSSCGYDETVYEGFREYEEEPLAENCDPEDPRFILHQIFKQQVLSGFSKEVAPWFKSAHYSLKSGLAPVVRNDYLFLSPTDKYAERLVSYFGLLSMTRLPSPREVYELSFVTDRPGFYDYFANLKLHISGFRISVILIDKSSYTILKQSGNLVM